MLMKSPARGDLTIPVKGNNNNKILKWAWLHKNYKKINIVKSEDELITYQRSNAEYCWAL